MMLPITAVSAAFLTVLYVTLALRIIAMRRAGTGPSVGTGDNERFVRAVRAHGNLGEYAPLFLILLGLTEASTVSSTLISVVALLFVTGRILHAIGFGVLGTGPWRTLGMVATNTALLTLAGAILFVTFTS